MRRRCVPRVQISWHARGLRAARSQAARTERRSPGWRTGQRCPTRSRPGTAGGRAEEANQHAQAKAVPAKSEAQSSRAAAPPAPRRRAARAAPHARQRRARARRSASCLRAHLAGQVRGRVVGERAKVARAVLAVPEVAEAGRSARCKRRCRRCRVRRGAGAAARGARASRSSQQLKQPFCAMKHPQRTKRSRCWTWPAPPSWARTWRPQRRARRWSADNRVRRGKGRRKQAPRAHLRRRRLHRDLGAHESAGGHHVRRRGGCFWVRPSLPSLLPPAENCQASLFRTLPLRVGSASTRRRPRPCCVTQLSCGEGPSRTGRRLAPGASLRLSCAARSRRLGARGCEPSDDTRHFCTSVRSPRRFGGACADDTHSFSRRLACACAALRPPRPRSRPKTVTNTVSLAERALRAHADTLCT